MDGFALRRERLMRQFPGTGVQALLVSQPINVSYLTGFTGEASHLLLSAGKTVLISDGRFPPQLAEEGPGLETYIRSPGQTLPEATSHVLTQLGVSAVEFESGHLTVAEHQGLADRTKSIGWKPGTNRV